MLRIYDGGAIDVTLLDGYDPPRPARSPQQRRTAAPSLPDATASRFLYDGGLTAPGRSVRFVSSETQGFLTPAQVTDLETLYENGGAFQIDTDLLGAYGSAPVTYNALWQPGTVPIFPLADLVGNLYFLDLPVIVKEA